MYVFCAQTRQETFYVDLSLFLLGGLRQENHGGREPNEEQLLSPCAPPPQALLLNT